MNVCVNTVELYKKSHPEGWRSNGDNFMQNDLYNDFILAKKTNKRANSRANTDTFWLGQTNAQLA